jgi:hypothetical protein
MTRENNDAARLQPLPACAPCPPQNIGDAFKDVALGLFRFPAFESIAQLELEGGDAMGRIERDQGAAVSDRNELDPFQAPQCLRGSDSDNCVVAVGRELGWRYRGNAVLLVPFDEVDDGETNVGMNCAQPADNVLGQRDRDCARRAAIFCRTSEPDLRCHKTVHSSASTGTFYK